MSLIERYYKKFVRPRVFAESQDDAELAHEWGLEKLEQIQQSWWRLILARVFCTYYHPMLETTIFGVDFPNPFGLAAGYDKWGRVYHTAIPALGWGFCDVGGITKDEQFGNPRTSADPRIRRSEEYQSLWNALGFNNDGADKTAVTMSLHAKPPYPVFLNVGKSKNTPLDKAQEDYAYTIRMLWPYVDAIELNPFSPNTPGLRELQKKTELRRLLVTAQRVNLEMARNRNLKKGKPLGVKIAPDLSEEQLADIVEVCLEPEHTLGLETLIDFVTATNTTVSREGTEGWYVPSDRGGISGPPLKEKAEWVLGELYKAFQGKIALKGVGAIANGLDLYDRILRGADICAAFTAWTFEGPDFVRRCLKTLVHCLKSDGYDHVSEAVGAYWR